jgi:hypothetical protein
MRNEADRRGGQHTFPVRMPHGIATALIDLGVHDPKRTRRIGAVGCGIKQERRKRTAYLLKPVQF